MRSTDFDPACFRDHTINALGPYRQCHIGNKEKGAMMDQDDVNEYLMAIMGVKKEIWQQGKTTSPHPSVA